MSRPGVRLVQDGEGRLQHQHLQHLHALLLPAGEALVEVAVDEGLVHLHEVHGLAQLLDVRGDIHALAVRARPRQRSSMARLRNLPTVTPAISTGYWNARKTPRSARSLVLQRQVVLSVQDHAAPGHRVGGVTHEHVRQRALSRAVGSHERVDLSRADVEVQSLENRLVRRSMPAGSSLGSVCHLLPSMSFCLLVRAL